MLLTGGASSISASLELSSISLSFTVRLLSLCQPELGGFIGSRGGWEEAGAAPAAKVPLVFCLPSLEKSWGGDMKPPRAPSRHLAGSMGGAKANSGQAEPA